MSNPTLYNRWQDSAPFERVLFRPDRILQSAEANELQSALNWRLRGLADALFKDGAIMRDAGIVVSLPGGSTLCQAGLVYLAGAVRAVPEQTITVPTEGDVWVGIYLRRVVVTELEDPALLNPAAGTRGYMQPGAAREVIRLDWGVAGDGHEGTFCPIWLVENGVVRPKEPPPNLDAVTQALARYDRDSAGGSYIVRGLQLRALPDLAAGQQAYALAEGAARVNGHGFDFTAARRVLHAATPDLLWIDSEPHMSTTEGLQRIDIDRVPAWGEIQLRIVSRKTVDVVHGGFAGAADPLPDAGVLEIESAVQGATTYTPNADYRLTAGQVDWSPAGAEPNPGSTYQVTYRYMHRAVPVGADDKGASVSGALPGTLVQASYHHALRRIDRLVLGSEGRLSWIKGVSAPWTPVPPTVPPDALTLASVHQFWDSRRRVVPDGVRMVPMQTLVDYDERMDTISTDLAELRLAVDIAGRHSGIKKGLFADPLIDDSLRDAGRVQTAHITGGALRLPLRIDSARLGTAIVARTAPAHANVPVVSQLARTEAMKVNPYAAFDPLPRAVVLRPSVDRWTQTQDIWLTGRASNVSDATRTVTNVVRTSRTSAIERLRPTVVEFDLAFPPGETLTGMTFGGQAVVAEPLPGGTLVASAQGVLKGQFTVPDTLPAGTYEVAFTGQGGSIGSAMFTGQGTLVQREIDQIITMVVIPRDPLAQTFTLAENAQITGLRLWFEAKGASDILVQVRECSQGLPTRAVLSEARLKPAHITTGQPTTVHWPPVLLQREREYCVVLLCDDADAAVSVATLGEWDTRALRWVTAQPYQIGVLLSSSNASTWTPHNDKDLTFELLRADYGAAGVAETIELGQAIVDDATDLIVQAFAHQPNADATCTFRLTLDDASTYTVTAGQVVSLPSRYSGGVQAQAVLGGKAAMGAVLEPGIQLLSASLQTEGTYITPTITAGNNATVRVIYEADLPAGSAVNVHVQADTQGAEWVQVPFASSSPSSVGIIEITHALAGFSAAALRVRLTLTGTHTARPAVRNLRVVVL